MTLHHIIHQYLLDIHLICQQNFVTMNYKTLVIGQPINLMVFTLYYKKLLFKWGMVLYCRIGSLHCTAFWFWNVSFSITNQMSPDFSNSVEFLLFYKNLRLTIESKNCGITHSSWWQQATVLSPPFARLPKHAALYGYLHALSSIIKTVINSQFQWIDNMIHLFSCLVISKCKRMAASLLTFKIWKSVVLQIVRIILKKVLAKTSSIVLKRSL